MAGVAQIEGSFVMKLYVDTSAKQVTVTREPAEKQDAERPSEDRARDGPADVVDAGVRPGRRGRRGHHRYYGRRKAERDGGAARRPCPSWRPCRGRLTGATAWRSARSQIKAAPGVTSVKSA